MLIWLAFFNECIIASSIFLGIKVLSLSTTLIWYQLKLWLFFPILFRNSNPFNIRIFDRPFVFIWSQLQTLFTFYRGWLGQHGRVVTLGSTFDFSLRLQKLSRVFRKAEVFLIKHSAECFIKQVYENLAHKKHHILIVV